MLETSHRTTTKMSHKRSALRTNPKARDGLNSVLTKLRDGLEGRPGSVREVLRQVEELELTVKRQPILRKTLFNMSMKEAYLEVIDLPGKEVAAAIEQVMIAVARNILDGDGFGFSLPCRGNGDQVYVDELDRIVLKDKYALISFSGTSSVRKSRHLNSRYAAYTRGSVPWHPRDKARSVLHGCQAIQESKGIRCRT